MIKPGRVLDPFYDPVYSSSDAKSAQRGVPPSQYDILPIYNNMFSYGKNFPNSFIRFRAPLIPKVQSRPVLLSQKPQTDGHSNMMSAIQGAGKFLIFKRPLVPIASTYYMAKATVQPRKKSPMKTSFKDEVTMGSTDVLFPNLQTRGTQTIFRESSTQTHPYSPPYRLPKGTPPEILSLAMLSWNNGLPAGLAEVEMIQRVRERKRKEAALPPVHDRAGFEKRLRMLEEIELDEWMYREKQMKRLQEARVAVLKEIFQNRQIETDKINQERVEKIWQQKLAEKDAVKHKSERKKRLVERQIAHKKRLLFNELNKKDIISDFADRTSDIYSPKKRDGLLPHKCHHFEFNNFEKNESDLDAVLPVASMTLKAIYEKPKEGTTLSALQEIKWRKELEIIDQKIQKQHEKLVEVEKPLKFLVKVEKPPQRPPTPSIAIPTAAEDMKELSAIFIQRLIRGRAIQDDMFEGKDRRADLIDELYQRKLHPVLGSMDLLSSSLLDLSGKPDAALGKKAHQPTAEPTSSVGPAVDLNEEERRNFEILIQAPYVGQRVEFLSKELTRIREERRIIAMVELAQRTRRLREAEEQGYREWELERRAKQDEIFRQIMGLHEESVDSYLETIIMDSLNLTASLESRQQVRKFAESLNAAVDQSETRTENETVSDLVSSFLLPEVQRETLRQRVQADQCKYLHAANQVVSESVERVEQQQKEAKK